MLGVGSRLGLRSCEETQQYLPNCHQYRLGFYHRNIFDIPASQEPGISSDHSRSARLNNRQERQICLQSLISESRSVEDK